ncbi:TRAP transporter substrate-binding protein [Roseibium aggregatum]|uniref:TRAP transporter substrate-binding protein n=1 Tax=Roseibium aggregatum TaxID=187304 RepID=A0A939ED40_9HYPH|nr:TRAP transporter substrate-binding protein [Roseibium aggregatum]MBN9669399.1 TRAP transporter substrate-binding protein [Roseibium aggregatum]
MTRKILKCTAAALALFGASTVAQAQDVTLILHHFMSPKSPPHTKFLEPWAEKVEAESDGRIKVELFPSMSMGGKPGELYRQVRDGSADIVLTITGYTPGVFPRSEVFELPTVHQNSALATTQAIANNFELVADDYSDVHPLLVFANAGNAIHTVDGCVSGPDDLKDKKLRTPSRTGAWLIEEWKAEPVGMPVPALPEALSKGVVDGALLPFEIMPPYKIHELTNCSVTAENDGRFGASVFLFAMNKDRYDELPDDLKAVIDANAGVAIAPQVGQLFNDIEAPGKKLQAGTGSPVNALDGDATAAINQAGEKVVARWIEEANGKGLDGKALVDAARAAITENSQ